MISDIAGSTRILVVDDDPTSVELVKRVLMRAGFSSVDATSEPTAALSMLREIRPHVVLLDLRMPGIDGFSLMDTIRIETNKIGSSIIMLTSEADQDIQVAALRGGASDFVTKPFVAPVLVARVANAAEMCELQRQLLDRNSRLQEEIDARTERLQQALDVLSRAETGLRHSLELSQAESKEKADMIAELAHELRTPLTAICGFSEIMRDQQFGPLEPRYLAYASDIHLAGMHALHVVNGFLELAKIEAGQDPLSLSVVDIGRVVRESVSLVAQQAELSTVAVTVTVKPGLDPVSTDGTKLFQIVLNIVSNAVKFTPAGGTVSVEVGPTGRDSYVILVRDTGIGIEAKDMAEVMRPFGQVRQAQIGRPKGTGLGLPLARQYVALLGGNLTMVSQPGQGTLVTIELPNAPPANRVVASERKLEEAYAGGRGEV